MSKKAIAWFTDDYLTDKSATTFDPEVAGRWRSKGWPVTPLFADVADSFTTAPSPFRKGFNTLETGDGKYKIVMQFADRDDAWTAYKELSRQTTIKESE